MLKKYHFVSIAFYDVCVDKKTEWKIRHIPVVSLCLRQYFWTLDHYMLRLIMQEVLNQ